MWNHWDLEDDELAKMLKSGDIQFSGNPNAKIFGRLDCGHGMRLNRDNRVFFATEEEARRRGYRPCGHCMRYEYMLDQQKMG
ncbi:MAG: Ada metal-binding domain-containing protein [Pseudomonadota bacterium]